MPGVLAAIGAKPLQIPTPRGWRQAKQMGQDWIDCTYAELQSILDFGVVVPLAREAIPDGANIIGSQFVYKAKYHRDGSLDKHKSRLVARGDQMIAGMDYTETFAPVSDLTTIRALLSTSLAHNMTPRHVDVKCAFLNSTLNEEVYIRLPDDFTVEGKGYGRAVKSIYGLKQAAHDWYETQHRFLMSYDSRLQRSDVDPCLYHLTDGDLRVCISTHVDDYIISSTSDQWYEDFAIAFGTAFEITELGVVSHLLQMSVDWDDGETCKLGQERQIMELAHEYGLVDAKPVQTPMAPGLQLPREATCDSTLPYRSLLGSLLWLARNSRPDVYYHVLYLSQFSSCYGAEHYKALKRVLKYLISTSHYRLTYSKPGESTPVIEAYCDSDWAGDESDRKSVSGGLTFLFGNLVSWGSRKQKTVALSSCEAEYMAITEEMKDILYLTHLMEPIVELSYPVTLHIDNMGAGYMAQNAINNQRTKHIDIRYHFIRQHIQDGKVELFYIDTKDNIADCMTKSLTPEIYVRLTRKFMDSG